MVKWRMLDLPAGPRISTEDLSLSRATWCMGTRWKKVLVVAGGFQASGGELVGDVFCGALVGFGAGVAAFHGIV